jgi:hypothetical protein
LGEHTACDLPISLRVTISERGRCLPHKKHDMVELPEKGAVAKGDPPTLDL